MKIAVYTNSIDGSGARRALYEIIKGLSAKNEIDLFCLSSIKLDKFPILNFIDNLYSYDFRQYKAIAFTPYLFGAFLDFFKKIYYVNKLKKISKRMCEDINSKKYDIAIIDVCTSIRIPHHPRYLKIPNVVYYHGLKTDTMLSRVFLDASYKQDGKITIRNIYKKISKAFFEFSDSIFANISNKNCKAASLVLTNSYYMRESLYRICGVLPEVCYLGVDLSFFRPLPIEKKDYVLSVGGIEDGKCFDFILKSISLIPLNKRPKLVIVSSRTQKKVLSKLLRLSKKLDVQLTVLENIYGSELVKIYSEASIFCFVPWMEAFGLVVLESMACGTPVVGIREGGVREVINDLQTGLLIDRNELELSLAIEKLKDDPQLYKNIRENALRYIEMNWNWPDRVADFENKILTQLSKE